MIFSISRACGVEAQRQRGFRANPQPGATKRRGKVYSNGNGMYLYWWSWCGPAVEMYIFFTWRSRSTAAQFKARAANIQDGLTAIRDKHYFVTPPDLYNPFSVKAGRGAFTRNGPFFGHVSICASHEKQQLARVPASLLSFHGWMHQLDV